MFNLLFISYIMFPSQIYFT